MKRIFCFSLLLVCVFSLSAQEVYNSSGRSGGFKRKEQKGYDPSKLIIGGVPNAGYSSDFVNLGIAPILGYKFTPHFAAGISLGYQYYKQYQLTVNNVDYYAHENIVSPGVWTKFFVYHNIFISGEFEYCLVNLNGHDFDYSTGLPVPVPAHFNTGVPALLFGPGQKVSLGGRVTAFYELMFDVLHQVYSPYYDGPGAKIGICVGL